MSESHMLPCRHPMLTSRRTLSKDVFQSCCTPRSGWERGSAGCTAPVRWVRCSCAVGALPLPLLAISRLPRAGQTERPLLKCYRMARDAFGSPAKACQRRFER